MVFSTKATVQNAAFNLYIDDHKLMQVSKTKFLGVIIDNKLTWEHHIAYVKNKISKCIGLLYRARTKVYTSILKLLYNTIVLPHFTYCIAIWGNTYKKYIHPIGVIQKKVIHLITFSARLARSRYLSYEETNAITSSAALRDAPPPPSRALTSAKS